MGDETRLDGLIRDGKLYLTLQDAIALALENNLDVETERYNITLASTDVVRAKGGGSTRGLDFTTELPQNGVGGPGSPLLNAATVNSNPTTPTVTDLTSLNSTTQTQQSLSQLGAGFTYSPGPTVPLFDPQLIGDAGYLRRSDTVTLGVRRRPGRGREWRRDDGEHGAAGFCGGESWRICRGFRRGCSWRRLRTMRRRWSMDRRRS